VNSKVDRQSQKRTMKALTIIKRHDTQHKSHRPCQLVCFTHQTNLGYYWHEWWHKQSAKVNRTGNIKRIELHNTQLVHMWIPNSLRLLQPHLPPKCDQLRTGGSQLPLIINTTVSKCSTRTNFIQTYKHQPHPYTDIRNQNAWSRIEQW